MSGPRIRHPLEIALAAAALSLFVGALLILGPNRTFATRSFCSVRRSLPLVLTETRLRTDRVLLVLLPIVTAFYPSSLVGTDQGGGFCRSRSSESSWS